MYKVILAIGFNLSGKSCFNSECKNIIAKRIKVGDKFSNLQLLNYNVIANLTS